MRGPRPWRSSRPTQGRHLRHHDFYGGSLVELAKQALCLQLIIGLLQVRLWDDVVKHGGTGNAD